MEPSLPPPDGGFATRAVHGALTPPVVDQQPSAPAIWPAATWSVERSRDLAELLGDERDGYVYGRYDNPTATALHAQVASLHGAEAAWTLASGTAAIHATLDVLRRGAGQQRDKPGRILATPQLYGGTWALLDRLGRDAGWEVDHVDLGDLDGVRAALTAQHTIVYAETIANPSTAVADLAGLAEVCAQAGVALVVDNTFASPYLCRPLEHGADVVVESATKYLGGHGDVVAGVVAGSAGVVAEARHATIELGGSLGAFEAWLVARGIQTLPLRMRQASESALAVATALRGKVDDVAYPGLDDHPQHALAREQFDGRGFGGVLSFDAGDRARAEAFADACHVFARAVSLGGTRSLVMHPASTSHRQLDERSLAAAGLSPGTVRLSVGIEDTDDLLADVDQAWAAARGG